jgi:tetratricopeptide (TPR) repeat protein
MDGSEISIRQGNASDATAWYQRAIETLGADAPLLVKLAEAQLQAGFPAAALATLQRALDKDPFNRDALALARRMKPLPCHLRIHAVPEPIPKEVESEDEGRNRQSRKNRQVRRVKKVRPPRIQHRPPAWSRWLHAKAKETQ